MPGRRCLHPADCLLSNESLRRCAWFALIFTPRLKRFEGGGLRWHRACFDETPVQSHFLLSRQFLNSFPHSSSSVLPISAFPSPPHLPTPKLLHDRQMAPMRFCRGLAHGNVSWPHIALGLKTDANCRTKELGVPFIAVCLFCPSLD